MENTALSSYTSFTKVVILAGVPFFFMLAILGVSLSLKNWPISAAGFPFALSFGALGLFGLRLLPFINSSFAATSEGLYIYNRKLAVTFLPWASISRVKDWPGLQVMDVHDVQGKRVMSIDYGISNFEPLRRRILENAPARA